MDDSIRDDPATPRIPMLVMNKPGDEVARINSDGSVTLYWDRIEVTAKTFNRETMNEVAGWCVLLMAAKSEGK